MLDWLWPWMFALLPLPWLLRRLLPPAEWSAAAARVPFHDDLVRHAPRVRAWAPTLQAALATALWCLLLVAAARPVWFGEPVELDSSGRDLLLAVDLSDSMRIDDMQSGGVRLMRIDIVKSVLGDFVQRRRGDRIGLILFGQRSYLQTPLTHDRDAVRAQLDEALPGFAGSSTAIGDAIGLAITTLRDRPAQSRVLVLLTDGANTFGSDPLDAAAVAAEAGIRIHAIGIGSTERLTVHDPAGGEIEIDPSRDLDETTLRTITETSGGRYFRATDPQEIDAVYATIDTLEPSPEPRQIRPQRSLFHWPLAAALFCALPLLAGRPR